jgi:translation initiation factor 4E
MWEDEQCAQGGRWMLKIPKSHTNKFWEDLTLALIGEQFTQEDEVLGLQLALKPVQDVLSVWIRHGKDQEKVQ